jgi:hypothetical protein
MKARRSYGDLSKHFDLANEKKSSHVVYHRRGDSRVMAFGFLHAYGRRLDSRPAGHRGRYISFQSNQRPGLGGLASKLSGPALSKRA